MMMKIHIHIQYPPIDHQNACMLSVGNLFSRIVYYKINRTSCERRLLPKVLQNPHDKFFKETFGNVVVAQDFLCNYLPTAVIQHIDMQTLEPQKDSFIDKELEETFSDLLFKANIAGQEGFLYFLFEHKSYPDKGIAFQLLRYMVDIWTAKMKKETSELPLVIPLVIYHGRPNWHIPSS